MSEMKRNAELLELVDYLQKEVAKLESQAEMASDVISLQSQELQDCEATLAQYKDRYGEL